MKLRAGSTRSRILLLAAGSAALIALCSCSATPAPQSPPASAAPATSATPTPTPPTDVNATTAALQAAARWLRGQGYTIDGTSGAYLKFSDQGVHFTSKMTCEGGATHEVGWTGICAAPSKEAINVVVALRITAGPKTETLAMDEDTAAYCGDAETPAWVKKALKSADIRYCYLRAEDG